MLAESMLSLYFVTKYPLFGFFDLGLLLDKLVAIKTFLGDVTSLQYNNVSCMLDSREGFLYSCWYRIGSVRCNGRISVNFLLLPSRG